MKEQLKKAHLGCGLVTPDGWINIDGSWNARLAKYPIARKLLKSFHLLTNSQFNIPWSSDILVHDLRRPLPFPDCSLAAIYSSNLLEHLYLEEAKLLLRECYRVLEIGGILRIVVPDLQAIVHEYIRNKGLMHSSITANSADILLTRLHLRNSNPPVGNFFFRMYVSKKDYHSHKWMYDVESLMMYFKWAGFENVQAMDPFNSRIPNIDEIELAGCDNDEEMIRVEGLKY